MKAIINIDIRGVSQQDLEKRLAEAFPDAKNLACEPANVVNLHQTNDMSVSVVKARETMQLCGHSGFSCPVCNTIVRSKKHNLGKKDKETLEIFANHKDFVQASQLGLPGGDYAKLKHWGFLEPEREGKASKRWRITKIGRDFLDGKIGPVPKAAVIFRGQLMYLDKSGEMVTIKDITV